MKFLLLSAAAAAALLAQPEPPLPPLSPMPPMPAMPGMAPMAPMPMKPGMGPMAPRPGKMPMHFEFAFDQAAAFAKVGREFAFAMQGGRGRSENDADREYERGQRDIEKKQWESAVNHFQEIVALGKYRADAALYWKALALSRLGKAQEAAAALDTLSKTYAQSNWAAEGQKLRSEINTKPLTSEEEEIKLTAMQSLMHSDPERAIPLLEKMMERRSSPQIQEQALRLLAQSNQPKAKEAVTKAAKGGVTPNLQLRAVRHLGSNGSAANRQILNEVYASSTDPSLKRQVLHSYMAYGDRDRVFAVAKSESDVSLRREAIHLLGGMGAQTQLAELYSSETNTELRGIVMRSLMASGGSSKLIEIAKTEKDPELRQMAISHLGGMNSQAASDALVSMYQSSGDSESRKRIMRSLAAQNNAKQLIDLAKTEKDPELRRQAVQHLSHMRSAEANAYLMELLK